MDKCTTDLWAINTGEVLSVVDECSKVLSAVPWPLMVWSTLALGTYQLTFVSWVFHVIFSFVHFISLYTLGGLRAFRKPLPYNMYLFNLWIANHILIKIFKIIKIFSEPMYEQYMWGPQRSNKYWWGHHRAINPGEVLRYIPWWGHHKAITLVKSSKGNKPWTGP